MCIWCRAGQELGPSAALAPLQKALSSLQSVLQPSSRVQGPVTADLLQHLSQAALFQELCSGDMHAVPGLLTSSRLNCLMQLLQDEASALPTRQLSSTAKASAVGGTSGMDKITVTNATASPDKRSPEGLLPSDSNGDLNKAASMDTAMMSTGHVCNSQHGQTQQGTSDKGKASEPNQSQADKSEKWQEVTEATSAEFDTLTDGGKASVGPRRAVIFVGEDVTAHR